MLHVLIILMAVILLVGLLFFENNDNIKGKLPTKALLSFLFVLVAFIQPHPMIRYSLFLLLGLLLCLVGDICLVFKRDKMFLLGLISFLLGHVAYIFGFFHIANLTAWTWIGFTAILLVSSGIYLRLKPHLMKMKAPVLFYCIVITIMLAGAWSVLINSELILSGRLMVFGGAFSFYISDVLVARDRFLKEEFFNRLIGLPLYYTGQFALAFSLGYLDVKAVLL